MKKLLMLTLAGMMLFNSCESSSGPQTSDYSQCIQGTPDYRLLLNAPAQYKDADGVWGHSVGLTLRIDSIANSGELPKEANYPPDFFQDGNENAFFAVTSQGFNCNVNVDTCYGADMSDRAIQFGMNPMRPAQWVYHYDTLSWETYSWAGTGGTMEQILCRLDTVGGIYLQPDGVEDYDFRFVKDVIILDTIAEPSMRSQYKRWWPLPREPWAQGESVWADSTLWADSVADSTELWSY